MPDLLTLSTPELGDDGRLLWHVPDGWQQGRGCFGGLQLAAAVRAAMRHVDPELPLRSLSAVLVAPVMPGAAEMTVARVRDGHNTAIRRVEIGGDTTTCTEVTLVFGRERAPGVGWNDVSPPDVAPWGSVAPAPSVVPMAPRFAQHVEFRVTGSVPFTGDTTPTAGWVRFRDRAPRSDAARLVALADAWWPAALCRMRQPRPMATIHYMLQLLHDGRDLDPDAPVYHRATCDTAVDGYATERRELFDVDGRLLCINQQTFVMIA